MNKRFVIKLYNLFAYKLTQISTGILRHFRQFLHSPNQANQNKNSRKRIAYNFRTFLPELFHGLKLKNMDIKAFANCQQPRI